MQQAIEQLRRISPAVVAAAVVGPDGQIEASSAQGDLGDVVGPSTVALTAIAARAAQELGRGALETSILEGSYGRVIAQDVGDGRTLVVVSETSSQLGLLLDDVGACRDQVRGSAHA